MLNTSSYLPLFNFETCIHPRTHGREEEEEEEEDNCDTSRFRCSKKVDLHSNFLDHMDKMVERSMELSEGEEEHNNLWFKMK